MTIFNFGGGVNDYVEVPDPLVSGQVKRPPAGVAVLVRNAVTLAAITATVTSTYGYLTAYSTTDVPLIEVSADGGTSWRLIQGRESIISAATAGTSSAEALQLATTALAKADTAVAAVTPAPVRTAGSNVCDLLDKLTPFARVNIPVDPVNTISNLWPDRLAFYFEGTRTGYFNEYGEIRARSAKATTQALRVAGFLGGSTGNILEVTAFAQGTIRFAVSETAGVFTVPVSAPNIGANRVTVGATAPTSPAINDAWIDTSGATNAVKVWTGTVWDA
jgi:hypothetical protein